MKLIDKKTLESVRTILDYMYVNERNDYEEAFFTKKDEELPEYTTAQADLKMTEAVKGIEHIFNDVARLGAFLEEGDNGGQANPHVRITPFESPRTNKPVANQWVITTDEGEFFQSYKSIIAFTPYGGGKTVLDEKFWDYSTTTGKYRNEFLGEGIEETRKKIASGEYTLANLNQ